MNWGKGIAIFLVLFIGFILTLAIILMQANTDLVGEDYYIKEIAYEDEIVAESNAQKAGAKIETEVSEEGLFIHIKNIESPEDVTIHLLRGNDQDLDVSVQGDGAATFIERSELVVGKYILTITWKNGDKSYQIKKDIWVN
jgi:hypothetical protein